MAQLIPMPLTVFCVSKIQIDFIFLVPATPGCPLKRLCVCVLHVVDVGVCQCCRRQWQSRPVWPASAVWVRSLALHSSHPRLRTSPTSLSVPSPTCNTSASAVRTTWWHCMRPCWSASAVERCSWMGRREHRQQQQPRTTTRMLLWRNGDVRSESSLSVRLLRYAPTVNQSATMTSPCTMLSSPIPLMAAALKQAFGPNLAPDFPRRSGIAPIRWVPHRIIPAQFPPPLTTLWSAGWKVNFLPDPFVPRILYVLGWIGSTSHLWQYLQHHWL